MLPSKHKIKLKCPTSPLCPELSQQSTSHHFYFYTSHCHFVTSLPPTEGRAGTAWKTSDQYILLNAPYYNNNYYYYNFSASHFTPYSLFFSFVISTFTLRTLHMPILSITRQSLVDRRFRKADSQDLYAWSGQTAERTPLQTSVKSEKFVVLHCGSSYVQGKATVRWTQLATNYLLKWALRFVTLALMVTLAFERTLNISMWI